MVKIILDKSKCIGCGSCKVVCSDFFELDEDGKPHLRNSKNKIGSEKEKLEIEEPGCIQEAIDICPTECISITNK